MQFLKAGYRKTELGQLAHTTYTPVTRTHPLDKVSLLHSVDL